MNTIATILTRYFASSEADANSKLAEELSALHWEEPEDYYVVLQIAIEDKASGLPVEVVMADL